MMEKVLKWLLISILGVIFLVFIIGWLLIGYELSKMPSDEVVIGYVEDLIDQDIDESLCHVIEKEFSTNIREYSLYVIIQFETEFLPTHVSSDLDSEDNEKLAQLIDKAFAHTVSLENVFYFADRKEELYYMYLPQENLLILNYK